MMIRAGQRPFGCEVCGKRFLPENTLQSQSQSTVAFMCGLSITNDDHCVSISRLLA